MKGKSKRTGPTEDWKARLNRLRQSFLTLWNKEFAEAKARGAELLRLMKQQGGRRPDAGRLKELLYQRLAVQELNVIFLGLCPLAWMVSSGPRALMLGILITLTLICTNALVSLLNVLLPDSVGAVCRVVVIAGFIAAFEIVLALFFPAQSRDLGSWIPLAAICCISLDLALNTTRGQGIHYLLADALFTGVSLTVLLLVIGLAREVLGRWTLFGFDLPGGFKPLTLMQQPAGGFLTLGAVTALVQSLRSRKGRRAEQ